MFFCLIRDEIILQLTERHAIAFRDHLSRLFALLWNNPCRFLIIIVLNIISNPHIVFSLCARVVWCDICAEFTNLVTGDPSSSCEMIILRKNSHGEIMSLYGNIYDRFKEKKSQIPIQKIPQLTSTVRCFLSDRLLR